MTQSEPWAQRLTEQQQRHQEFLRRQTLKKAGAVIRLKSKTRRLVELCEQVKHRVRKSEAWFVKYERFFRSPVWQLVSDEAIRKAHFKCECWGCTKSAIRVYLLELPEEHIEPNFDWMKRDNILIALCGHHYEIIHGFVMKRVVPADRQFDAAVPSGPLLATTSTDRDQLAKIATFNQTIPTQCRWPHHVSRSGSLLWGN